MAVECRRKCCRYVKLPLEVCDAVVVDDLVTECASVDDEGRVLSSDGSAIEPGACFRRSCRVIAVSDTHSLHDQLGRLPKGDLLIHCGDFCNKGNCEEYASFDRWLSRVSVQGFEDRMFCVVGNHDAPRAIHKRASLLPHAQVLRSQLAKQRLCPLGLRIFGQSWPEYLPSAGLPESSVDILLTHSPPSGILDTNAQSEHCGNTEVRRLVEKICPRLHLFGHIHEAYGATLECFDEGRRTLLLNISNATRPLGMPPIVPEYIQYPVTVIDIELPDIEVEETPSDPKPSLRHREKRQRRRDASSLQVDSPQLKKSMHAGLLVFATLMLMVIAVAFLLLRGTAIP